MTRLIIHLAILLLGGHLLQAQHNSADIDHLRLQFEDCSTDSCRVAACLDLSAYYIFKDNKLDSYLDSALTVLELGDQLARRSGSKDLMMAVSAMFGNYHVTRGDWVNGNKFSKKAIEYFYTKGDYLNAANILHQFGSSIDDSTRSLSEEKLRNFQSARILFRQLKLPVKTAETLNDIALCKARQHKFDTAEAIMREVIAIYRPIDPARMLEAYDALAEITEYQSDQHKQLKYRLELIDQMESIGDTSKASYYYSKLAMTYANISMYQESLSSIIKAIHIAERNKEYDPFYGHLSLAVFNYIQLGKHETALAFLLAMKKRVPPRNLAHTVDLHDMLGKCYTAMNDYDQAEHHFLMMMELFGKTQNTYLYETEQQQTIDFIHYNQVIGNFYVKRKEFQKAGVYFDNILRLAPGKVRPITLSKVHLMQFRVDSAANKFIPALNHYIRYKELQDSLFNLAKSQQLQELNIKYETEKQVRDLQINHQNIVSLTAQTKLQQAELARETLIRNIIIIFSLLLLGSAYFWYRFNQRHNLRLQGQQEEINDQNIQLRALVTAQKKLVAEKDWLLREVHHRVKNNLHTVISLLETQAAVLSDDALAAIQNSQHRIYAMSLIHQKLYLFENYTQINMAAYLPELLQYLQDSFDVRSKIVFRASYDNVELDLAQAIPIGLIFNEAITNAIKYAFPGGAGGVIEILMTAGLDDRITLSIADNGIGLPSDWKARANSTLGLKLMEGLSEDIRGRFNIETDNGTKVLLDFEVVRVVSALDGAEDGDEIA